MAVRYFFMIAVVVVFTGYMSGVSFSAEITNIEVIDYGIIEMESLEREAVIDAVTGYCTEGIGEVDTVKRTHDIPAQQGMIFGFVFIIHGFPYGEEVLLTQKTVFPESGIDIPFEGVKHDETYDRIYKIGKVHTVGYALNDKYELVPGTWTFQLLRDRYILMEERFNVYTP